MNLARVEYYLSDFLSVIESREKSADGKITTDAIAQYKEGIPDNLYIIGTVNMDETTFPFSQKVLDRAGIRAEKVLAVRKQITYDTQENRLVKFMLKATVRRIDDFTRRYVKSRQKPDEQVISGAKRMSGELQRLLGASFLAEVADYSASKSMSLVFGMAPGYRDLYKYYLMLQNGISVGGDIFHMSVRDTAQLYEYWCFINSMIFCAATIR